MITIKPQTYSRVRRNILNGDILLCSGIGPFSKLIRKFTDSSWSHVGFVLWLEKLDRLMVLESKESRGVRCVPLSAYIRNMDGTGKGYGGKVCIFRDSRIQLALKTDLGQLGRFAVDHFGYPYDNDEIARIVWRIVSRKKKGKKKQDQEYICSEFAAACFGEIGIKFPYDPRGFITPEDFARADTTRQVYELKVEKSRKKRGKKVESFIPTVIQSQKKRKKRKK